MTVAKRQREKPMKIEQKGPRTRKNEEANSLLASPIYIGQAQGEEKKTVKSGTKIEPLALFS